MDADDRIENLLRSRTRFARLVHVASCPSTQDLALADTTATPDPAKDAVFWADHQTRGRGRQRREWHDEPGADLLVTFRARLRLPAPTALPAALPAAIVEALEAAADRELTIKWPNDIHLDGRKLCGMLVDSGVAGSDVYLVGVGVNCNRVRFPPDLENTATSLALATGREVDLGDLLGHLAERIDRALTDLAERRHERLLSLFRDRLGLLGRRVEVTTNTAQTGVMTGIDFAELTLDERVVVPLGFVRAIRAAGG
ncbi:MAG: biotin--[acetyl-CoA-carboxylase] ligase [Planctomycetota bacterium]